MNENESIISEIFTLILSQEDIDQAIITVKSIIESVINGNKDE